MCSELQCLARPVQFSVPPDEASRSIQFTGLPNQGEPNLRLVATSTHTHHAGDRVPMSIAKDGRRV